MNLVTDFQNHYEECTREILQGCLNKEMVKKKIIMRDELLTLIEELPNVSDKFLILALFEGIYGKEYSDFFELRPDAFSKQGNDYVVKLPDREITCSSYLYHLGVQSADEYTMYIYKKDSVTQEYKFLERKFRSDDDRIIKLGFNAQQDKLNTQIFSRKLIRIKKYLGIPSINKTSLKDSGLLYEIQKRMKEGRRAEEIINDEDLIIKYGRVYGVMRFIDKYVVNGMNKIKL